MYSDVADVFAVGLPLLAAHVARRNDADQGLPDRAHDEEPAIEICSTWNEDAILVLGVHLIRKCQKRLIEEDLLRFSIGYLVASPVLARIALTKAPQDRA
jgi:hypothetical protein